MTNETESTCPPLRNWGDTKWPPFYRRNVQTHFLIKKFRQFSCNFSCAIKNHKNDSPINKIIYARSYNSRYYPFYSWILLIITIVMTSRTRCLFTVVDSSRCQTGPKNWKCFEIPRYLVNHFQWRHPFNKSEKQSLIIRKLGNQHYNDIIMGAIVSQITCLTIVY